MTKRDFPAARSAKLSSAAVAALLFAAGAHAQATPPADNNFTDAGTAVENTFTLDYSVAGAAQDTITNDDSQAGVAGVIVQGTPTQFLVDRIVDLDLISIDPSSTLVVAPGAPAAAGRVGPAGPELSFLLTNTGNDNQAYSLALTDGADSNGADLNFDATPYVIRVVVDDNGTPGFQTTGATPDTITTITELASTNNANAAAGEFTADVAPDDTILILVEGDIPEIGDDLDSDTNPDDLDNTTDDLVLTARARDPNAFAIGGAPTTPGAVTTASATNDLATADNVLIDGTGATDGAADGLFSAASRFLIASPDLDAVKTVRALQDVDGVLATCDGIAATADPVPAQDPNVFATPGTCVEYIIRVVNQGDAGDTASDATDLDVLDVLPDNLTFVSASTDGFTGGAFSGTLPSQGDACDGTAGTCEVDFENATLASGAIGRVIIRAVIG